MKKPLLFFLCATLIGFNFYTGKKIYHSHLAGTKSSISSASQLPAPVLEAGSLEFKGLISDFFTLNVLTFLGEKLIFERPTTTDEWKRVARALMNIVELDPRSTDPYVLAATTLPWEADMVKETNEILQAVAPYQPENYQPYFFLWYNFYYFLKDNARAAEYLRKAAAIPGAPSYLAPLVSRMYLYSGKVEASIAFTADAIRQMETTDPRRKQMLKRLEALKGIYVLEGAVRQYRERFQRLPASMQELLSAKILKKVPPEPYGGKWIMNDKGNVYTSSKLADLPELKGEK